jgi:hypothetical protein
MGFISLTLETGDILHINIDKIVMFTRDKGRTFTTLVMGDGIGNITVKQTPSEIIELINQ